MWCDCQLWLFGLVILLVITNVEASRVHFGEENAVHSAVFLSPKFELEPGLVENKFYYNVDFPRGHIAIKEFNAEVVDEAGNSIPLYETYVHHLLVARYYTLKDGETSSDTRPEIIPMRNSGVCHELRHVFFGLGSEARKTKNYMPDPYGIVVGNPAEIPDGYEEQWLLGIHAIDSRGVDDMFGCIECRCEHYNATVDGDGMPLSPGYIAGTDCCHDQARCQVREGFMNLSISQYMRYRVKWVDWDDTIVPVKTYILDIAQTGRTMEGYDSLVGNHCPLEYDVEPCGISSNGCIHNKKTSIVMPEGGYVIYGGAHQHSGGINATLYAEDGRIICSSSAIYGDGNEAGNEAGYVVEMSTCYPQPGSMKISEGEKLVLESSYNNSDRHLGVMAIFYLMVVDEIQKESTHSINMPNHQNGKLSKYLPVMVFTGVAMVVLAVVNYSKRKRREGYWLALRVAPT